MKKAVLIIPANDFRDEELFDTKAVLEQAGIEVRVASTTPDEINGMLGGTAVPDMLVSDIQLNDIDALVFIGGSGAEQYWDDPLAHKLAQQAVSQNKVLAAICIAPVVLARAGVLKGRRATVTPYPEEIKALEDGGADYSARPVEKDGLIITGAGPKAVKEFAREIVRALK